MDQQEYWNQNIDKWADLYLEISHTEEEIRGNRITKLLYRRFITPYESRLMKDRFRLTMDFIDSHVSESTVVNDIGCGNGIFTVECLRRGASVNAIDFANSALLLTKDRVESLVPESAPRVKYFEIDVSKNVLPKADLSLAVGVTPYLDQIEKFLSNVMTTSAISFVHYLDPFHWANIVRRILPFLNVRRLNCFAPKTIDANYTGFQWKLNERRRFASGYIDTASILGGGQHR